MAIVVPVRVTTPIDKETMAKRYRSGDLNRVRQPLERSTLNQDAVNRTYDQQNVSSPQTVRTPVQPQQAVRVQNTPQQVSTPQPQPTASVPSTPQQRRRVPNSPASTELMRGQKWTVADKSGRVPASLKVCVGWDSLDTRCELDASAFMLGDNGKVPSDDWFIFYGQTNSPDGGVSYRSNAENMAAPDDAELHVQLNKIQPNIKRIAICVTIYEAASRGLNFGMVKNLYARVLDENGTEIAKFLLKECFDNVTAMVVGELYRHNGAWKFNPVGSGVRRELAEFCLMYGVELE